MRRKVPCSICRRWFLPDARAGGRQRVCSDPACQRERHRRNCADWRSRNPDYDREGRLKRKLVSEAVSDADQVEACAPLGRIDWQAARDLVGLEVSVLIEETGQAILECARDSVAAKLSGITTKSRKVPPIGSRDEMGRQPRAP